MRFPRAYLAAIALLFVIAFAVAYAWLGLAAADAAGSSAGLQLERTARLAAERIAGRPLDDALADSLGAAAGVRVTLISPDGRVLGDSEVPAERLPHVENHADREEVRSALAGAPGTATRASETVSLALLYYALPIESGVLRLAVPADEAIQPIRVARRIVLVTLIGLFMATLLLFRRADRASMASVESARLELGRIGAGDLARPSGAAASGPLGRSLTALTDRLRETSTDAGREAEDLRALFDGLEDGLAVIDGGGAVSLWNPAFEEWAGHAIEPGSRVTSLFRTPRLLEAVDEAQAGQVVSHELEVGERTILVSARPHRGGALLLLRDLTPLRRLEGVRRDFVANVSHELKTPLTSVIGFAEAIAAGDLPPETARDFGDRILANATRMRHLVDDLLDLALVESGRWSPNPEPLAVGEIAREVWPTLSPLAADPIPTLEVDDAGVAVQADREALTQILRNLLDNAARHSDGTSSIRVQARPDGRFVRVEVSDEGSGIPSAQLERVFERFYRVDPARSREGGGTGLGLAIVKHLVVGHGGDVGIESAVGQGTTVWLTLPIFSE